MNNLSCRRLGVMWVATSSTSGA